MKEPAVPKIYSSRNKICKSDKFVFISYSHNDKDIDYPVFNDLYEAGLNFWYDTEIKYGTDWFTTAQDALLDPNCIGILFFLSYNSVISEAISKEIDLVKDKLKINKDFKIIPIMIDNHVRSYYHLIQQAMKNVNESELNQKLPFERVTKFFNFFNERIKFMENKLKDSLVQDIISELKKFDMQLMSTSESAIKILQDQDILTQYGEFTLLNYGSYPASTCAKVSIKNGFFKLTGIPYYKESVVYNFAEISWNLLSVIDGEFTFISMDCFDIVEKSKIEQVIGFVKSSIEFTSENTVPIELSVPTTELITKYAKEIKSPNVSPFATRKYKDSHFGETYWAKEKDDYLLIDANNQVATYQNINVAGVRLIMTIKSEDIKRIK